jgi:hypothetical protein
MQEKNGGKGPFDPDEFVRHLGRLVESLPSSEEQHRNAAAIDAIIRFLVDMKQRLATVPTQEEAKSIRLALDGLSALFAKAKSNPVIAAAVGMRPPTLRPTTPVVSADDIENARRAIAQFDELPIDQLRLALADKSLSELKGLATELGLRSTKRTSHESLAHQIATRITNTRGYRSLRKGGLADER